MLDIGWIEMTVIAVLALIIIGPKDLPKAIKAVTEWVGRARAMAREFRSSLDDIVRETEIAKIRDEIESATNEHLIERSPETYDQAGADYTAPDFGYEIAHDNPEGDHWPGEDRWHGPRQWPRIEPGEGARGRKPVRKVKTASRPKERKAGPRGPAPRKPRKHRP